MRKLNLLLISLLVSLTMGAKKVTEQEALQKAQKILQGKQLRRASGLEVQVGQTHLQFKNLYVFNAESNGGFVIMSADDRTQSILGYATHGELNSQNLPCNVLWLLNYYESSIAQLGADDTEGVDHYANRSGEVKGEIVPLVDTQWGQGDPYNTFCPQHNGTRCVTGCVATAMAQIINYHRWPQAQTSSVPLYVTTSHQITMPELPASQFDWNNMNNNNIAQLMLYCGQSVHMDYDPAESGAYDAEVPTALMDVFGYSKSASIVRRNSYSNDEWNQMVYDELQQGHPVYYSGQSSEGGHAFIVDGYADGMFHLNWGWGGYCDGYFTLDRLNPNMDDGYNYSQGMVINGCPPADASDTNRPKAIVKEITCSERYLERSNSNAAFPAFTVTTTIESDLSVDATLQIGLALYDDNGLVKILAQDSYYFIHNDSYTSDVQVTIDASLPQGEYRIMAINRGDDTENWLPNLGGTTKYIAVSIGATNIQLQPMPKNEDEQVFIEFGIHNIDNITYRLYSYLGNLRASVLPYNENETEKYKGDIYIPNNINYQNMVFSVWDHYDWNEGFYAYRIYDSFSNAPELTSLSTPINLSIQYCPQLTKLELREGILDFGEIIACSLLESIIYPSTCNYFGAPRNCDKLNSITILNTHQVEINFANNLCWTKESMPALKNIYFAGDIPPSISGDIPQVNNDVTIHIPQGTMDVYKRSDWKEWNLVEDQPSVPVNVKLDYCGNDEHVPYVNGAYTGVAVAMGDGYNVECAMHIPAEHLTAYKDCQITAIEYYTPSPYSSDLHYEDAEYVFVTTPGTGYLTKQSTKIIRGTWTRVELEHPYTITGEELFVGAGRPHTFSVGWANYDIIEDALWLRVMGNDEDSGVWEKIGSPEPYNYPFPIRAIIEGENLPTDVVIASTELVESNSVQQAKEESTTKSTLVATETTKIQDGKIYSISMKDNNIIYNAITPLTSTARAPKRAINGNDKTQMRVKLRNRTPRLVKHVTLDWDVDGIKQEPYTIETAMMTNHDDIVYIDLPSNVAGRNHTANFKISEVDGEPDMIPANSNVNVNYITPATTYFPRKIVMEEATGTWCGYCPRGIVATEYMNEYYPDNFITIAIHDDAMYATESYFPFYSIVPYYPISQINRSYWYDPWPLNIDDIKDLGEAMITAEAEFTSDGKVNVNTKTTFGFSDNGSTEYRIAYVVLEDSVGPYYQRNYYSGDSYADDLLNWWVLQDEYVEIMFNDVARAIYDYDGIVGQLSTEIVEGETYQSTYTLTLPDNIQNAKNLKIVTLLLDTRTGEILNADRTAITRTPPTGVKYVVKDQSDVFDIYNMSGMKVYSQATSLKGLPRGVYIVNGKKIVIK